MASRTILLVEDDPADALLIRDALTPAGYQLVHCPTVAEGSKRFETLRPDLVILDVNLPDGSGLDVCRKIRSHPALAPTPVIVLTGNSELDDKAGGFAAGADHYLLKPYQIQELRLWVESLLRRVEYAEKEGGVLRVQGFVVDPQSHTATTSAGVVTNLTRKEFDLLYELVRRRPRVLSKEFLLSHLWDKVLRDNTVEAHVKNLRQKLGPDGSRIVTIPGAGYRFE